MSDLDIKSVFPELTRGALDKRFTERVETFASRMPSRFARSDSDAVVDEPSSNDALDLFDTIVKSFSMPPFGPA